ncbi:hypothetical protein [Demequina sp.]|uniref:hypothetical protein n=1 Tax=Demequina sp. TaxID=2050685 RepID=UPI0025C2FCE0|nr:hypothetical protein [Demequina sp.]
MLQRQEVIAVTKGPVDQAAIARASARSTKASARLEGRAVPDGRPRAVGVQRVLDAREKRS